MKYIRTLEKISIALFKSPVCDRTMLRYIAIFNLPVIKVQRTYLLREDQLQECKDKLEGRKE